MIIAFDASDINDSKAGIGMYAYGLVQALRNLDSVQLVLYTYNKELLVEFSNDTNVVIIEVPGTSGNFSWIRNVSKDIKSLDYDFFISPSRFFFSAFVPRTVQLLYDIFPIEYPQYWSFLAVLKYKIGLAVASRNASAFLSISEETKKRFIKRFPRNKETTFNIGIGISKWAFDPKVSEESISNVLEKYKITKPYFFSVSTLEPRKNYEMTIQAFAKFKEKNKDYKYVIAGKQGWFFESIYKTVETLGLEEHVIFTGYTPREDLKALLDGSKALLTLSIDEGVGIPPLEALARNKPVLASDIPVYREYLSSEVVFASPKNEEEIIAGLEAVSKINEVSVAESIFTKNSWKAVAENALFFLTSIKK